LGTTRYTIISKYSSLYSVSRHVFTARHIVTHTTLLRQICFFIGNLLLNDACKLFTIKEVDQKNVLNELLLPIDPNQGFRN